MQARHFNGRIALPQSPLRVLLDVRTAQPIPNFPLHPAAIQAESKSLYLYSVLLTIHANSEIP